MYFNFHICCYFRAKARPSKKARVNNPPEDQVVREPEQTVEPEQTAESEGPNPGATFDKPPPQDLNIDNQPEADTAVPDSEPADPIRADDRSSSPVTLHHHP